MATRFDMRCPICGSIEEMQASFGQLPEKICTQCGVQMKQFFGRWSSPSVNYGFRPERYNNETDRNIADYQFRHL